MLVSECCVFAVTVVGVIVQLTTSPEWQQVAIGRLISGLAVGALSVAVQATTHGNVMNPLFL
jgi:MFS transporter, SP family, sugar:H+ symporter